MFKAVARRPDELRGGSRIGYLTGPEPQLFEILLVVQIELNGGRAAGLARHGLRAHQAGELVMQRLLKVAEAGEVAHQPFDGPRDKGAAIDIIQEHKTL